LPKPLHEVGGVALIERTIRTLRAAGVGRVVVVTGFMADAVSAAVAPLDVDVVYNAEYERANGVSVLVGGAVVQGPFVLSMADHIYTPSIARLVGSQDFAVADLYLATDTRIHDVLDIDDATKVRSEDGRIVEIGKTLTEYDRIDCGVFAVTPALLDALAAVRAETQDCSLTQGVRKLAERGRARVVDILDGFWQDVDTAADRDHAEKLIRHHDPLDGR